MGAYRVLVRSAGQVSRGRYATLPAALDAAEQEARAAAARTDGRGIDLHVRQYAAGDLVAARAEIKGPQRLKPDVHAGFDVRNDGAVIAWTGGVKRIALTGEDPFAALRAALQSVSVEP